MPRRGKKPLVCGRHVPAKRAFSLKSWHDNAMQSRGRAAKAVDESDRAASEKDMPATLSFQTLAPFALHNTHYGATVRR